MNNISKQFKNIIKQHYFIEYMRIKKIKFVLNQVLDNINPSKEELKIINYSLKEFLIKIKKEIKKSKINAEIFIGGSFAKNTLIKKNIYDVDVFLRFDKKYKTEDISNLTEKLLKKINKNTDILKVHGSRDYFRIKDTKVPFIKPSFKLGVKPDNISPFFYFELIPVIKVKSSENYENITDLSYSHVKYIRQKIKSEKLLDEVRLAKSFCYANNCYGAESYIRGFSGYSLELLVYHYGTFLKFINEMIKIKDKKVIDIEKHHKNKQSVLMDLNSSKLGSPIVLIDPTYKQRNTLAALSQETFNEFKKQAKKFLKNPSKKAFEKKEINLENIKNNAGKKHYEFILLKAETDKQEGDIAGSKLLKFYNTLNSEIQRYFEVKNKGFIYEREKTANYFFVVKKREKILVQGPNKNDNDNVMKFKTRHKNVFIKKDKFYALEKTNITINEFIENWSKKYKKRLKEMYIEDLKII